MPQYPFEIIRSDRKTISLQIKDGTVLVRAPKRATQKEIEALLEKHQRWIEKHLHAQQTRAEALQALPPLTPEEIRSLGAQACAYIPPRVAYFAKLVGVSYGRITIRNQRSKWGSCSAKGNLNFNCLLMLAPPQVLDSVIVHELCHRKEMNHSPAFYREVYRVMPDYDRWNDWLKQNGAALMERMIRGQEGNV